MKKCCKKSKCSSPGASLDNLCARTTGETGVRDPTTRATKRSAGARGENWGLRMRDWGHPCLDIYYPWSEETAVKTLSRENGSIDFAHILDLLRKKGPLSVDIMVFGKNSTVILASFRKLCFWTFFCQSSCDFVVGPRAKPMVPIDSAGFESLVCIKKTHPESLRYF